VFYGDEEPVAFQLTYVSPLGRAPEPGEERKQSFSLLFQHSFDDKYLLQQSYKVTHYSLGELFIFLVPLGPGKDGMEYEAVFT
jgi:hypothetical protein